MAEYVINKAVLSDIADAIRVQKNLPSTQKITPIQMPNYIKNELLSNGYVETFVDRTMKSLTGEYQTIGDYALASCSALSLVDLPYCNTIGSNVFLKCTNLRTINLPNVSSVGKSAFSGCKPVNVTIGVSTINPASAIDDVSHMLNDNTNLQFLNLPNCTNLMSSAVSGATNLISVSLPNVVQVTQSAFYQCKALTSVRLPNCEGTLGRQSFDGCISLSYFSAPLITSMNQYTLRGCPITTLYAPELKGIHASDSLSGITTLKSVTIGYATIPAWSAKWLNLEYFADFNATAIASNAFYGCKNLNENGFHVPGLTTLTKNAFRATGFINIDSTTFPNVTNLGSAYIFYQCTSLESVDMPKVTGTLGNRVFSGCTNLTYVSLPNVTSVYVTSNYLPLLECPKLQSVNFNKLTIIPNVLFSNKASLTTVSIDAATTLNSSCFKGCTTLPSLTLPAVTKISAQAFYGCSLFSYLKIGTSNCALQNSNAFTGTQITSSTGSIMVPKNYLGAYKTATNWKIFSNRIFSY